jgi:peroxiredoxin/uncharacterized membrane protein YphA (DoxX/SURF4 family)
MKAVFNSIKINRNIVCIIAAVIIGATFVISGTGKLLGLEETPAQIVDFINAIIPAFLLTPAMIYFLYHVLVPYLYPLAELFLGLFLLIGFVPRLIAVLCLPLLLSFLGTNIWSISKGAYSTCADCFGIWEQIFGALTPVQSLIYDIVLLCSALAIIVFFPGKFLSSRQWLSDFFKGPSFKQFCSSIRYYSHIQNLLPEIPRQIRRLITSIQMHPLNTVVVCVCLICVGIGIYGMVILFNTNTGNRIEHYEISNLAVSEITDKTVTVSWATDSMTMTSIQLYNEKTASFRVITDKMMNTVHIVNIDNLMPETRYYFLILPDGIPDYDETSTFTFFQTLAADTGKPVISDVHINYMSDSDIIVSWTTDRPTTGEIEYWLPDAEHKCKAVDETLSTIHNIQLTMLETDATYQYMVKSADEDGNEAISNKENTFTLDFGNEIGKRAPDFTLLTLDGQSISFNDYSGKCIMLNFWMISCPGCRHKLPYIQEAYEKLSPEQGIILNIHTGGREDLINSFIESEEISFPVLLDLNREVTSLYEVTGVPTTFFIDRSGIIQAIDEQFESADELLKIFNTLCGD